MADSGATIFAPATAVGKAGVAVIRISGRHAGDAVRALCGQLPRARMATRADLRDPATGERLDDGLVLWFPAPKSFTGEDVAELHVHGARAVIADILGVLAVQPGLRLARPGEFARRAFDAGKLDLAQVEALADLIAAETRAQARQALQQLGGALGAAVEALRTRILRLRAQAEAEIDFPDESDVPGGLIAAMAPELAALDSDIGALIGQATRGERLRNGYTVALLGPPNAGKSSLLNRLARREAAIVSSMAGTTRDAIEVHLDLGGWPVTLIDTAGLRALAETDDGDPQRAIEREGIRRTQLLAKAADLRVLVLDATAPAIDDTLADYAAEALVVHNKIDLSAAGAGALGVSAATGEGLAGLETLLAQKAAAALGEEDGQASIVTRARHREALEDVRTALQAARAQSAAELIAEDLRRAADALGRIVGRTGVEDVLDLLFAEFCIGK